MKQILCYGDSNTYGLIPGTADRYPWNVRWTGILANKINEDQKTNSDNEEKYHVIEEGLCGRTTTFDDVLRPGRNGSDLLPIILETHRPIDLIILMLGTNDCKTVYNADAGVIGKGIEKLIDQIEAGDPAAKILLISPIYLGKGVWEEGFDREFNKRSVEVSQELGDVYQKIARQRNISYLNASDFASPSEKDREHLDEEGHKALAQAVYKKVAQLFL